MRIIIASLLIISTLSLKSSERPPVLSEEERNKICLDRLIDHVKKTFNPITYSTDADGNFPTYSAHVLAAITDDGNYTDDVHIKATHIDAPGHPFCQTSPFYVRSSTYRQATKLWSGMTTFQSVSDPKGRLFKCMRKKCVAQEAKKWALERAAASVQTRSMTKKQKTS